MTPTILTRLVAIQFQLHFAACESIRLNGHVWCGLNGRYRKAKQKNKKYSKRCWSTLFQTEATWIYFQRQIYLCVLEKNMSSYSWQCGILSSKTIINLILARKQIEGCEVCCHNACFVCIKYCCSKKETTQWKTTTTQCVCVRYAMWLHINASFQFVLCLCANEILKACYIHSGALFVVHTSVHDVMVILFCLFVYLFSLFFGSGSYNHFIIHSVEICHRRNSVSFEADKKTRGKNDNEDTKKKNLKKLNDKCEWAFCCCYCVRLCNLKLAVI